MPPQPPQPPQPEAPPPHPFDRLSRVRALLALPYDEDEAKALGLPADKVAARYWGADYASFVAAQLALAQLEGSWRLEQYIVGVIHGQQTLLAALADIDQKLDPEKLIRILNRLSRQLHELRSAQARPPALPSAPTPPLEETSDAPTS